MIKYFKGLVMVALQADKEQEEFIEEIKKTLNDGETVVYCKKCKWVGEANTAYPTSSIICHCYHKPYYYIYQKGYKIT